MVSGVENFLAIGITIAALWHVAGFAFGLVFVWFSLQSLLGRVPYDRRWAPVIRSSDLHLWLSGFLLVALGALQKGVEVYFSNPKLWAKMTVIIVWMLSTQVMRRYGVPRLRAGDALPMLRLSALNVACWIYGAFLGCAKPLAYGVASYPQFLLGFAVTVIGVHIALQYGVAKTRSAES